MVVPVVLAHDLDGGVVFDVVLVVGIEVELVVDAFAPDLLHPVSRNLPFTAGPILSVLVVGLEVELVAPSRNLPLHLDPSFPSPLPLRSGVLYLL